jgi:hypothetical protein
MIPPQNPTELIPLLLERNGKDELRFVASCKGCGAPVLDPTEANVAVVGGTAARPKPIGTHFGAKVSRLSGRAFVYCWSCDGKEQGNRVPWDNSAQTFRDRNDAAQQRQAPPFRSASTRRAGYAR